MRNSILLLGAGFSKNWGGWLADEAYDYLFGLPEIGRDSHLREIMLRHQRNGGFEAALQDIQEEYRPEDVASTRRLDAFQGAIQRMFGDMNEAFFNHTDFEFSQIRSDSVRSFLSRFDAIFTLNQDLLLEHHYVDTFDVSLELPKKWHGIQLPGLRPIWSHEPTYHRYWSRASWEPLPDSQYKVDPHTQPIFKPHGSSNWISSKGKPLLVIGGKKEEILDAHKILRRYRTELQARLCQPDTQLMIIGYSFRDHHINRTIADAVYKHDLEFSIISPAGRNIAGTFDSKTHKDIPLLVHGYDLNHVFAKGLRIVSTRPLKETFGGGSAEHRKVIRFFE